MMENEILKDLDHENKFKRRNALTQLQKVVSASETLNLADFETYQLPLISCLSDNSEINRITACKILESIFMKGLKSKSVLSYIVPTLHHRLSCIPSVEECEENRLEFLILIELMIDLYKDDILTYTNDLCSILIACLQDNYPEVIMKACNCIVKLPSIMGCKFQIFSSSFVKYLLQAIEKNRFKVRIKSLDTLGCIYVHGSDPEFGERIGVLLKRMNDVPQVKLALLSLGHVMCLQMKDRYNYWPKILPFVLFGLRDRDENIRKKAIILWNEIGTQYATENEIRPLFGNENLKCAIKASEVSSLDFGIGCCALIERNFHRMLEDISSKMRDWQEDTRLNSLKLLTVCLLGSRENSLQYSMKIFTMLRYSVNDMDSRIVVECFICGEVLGQFLPPDLYIPLIENSIWEKESDGSMEILSSLVKTTSSSHLEKSIHLFVKLLSFNNIETEISIKKQRLILDILEVLSNCKLGDFRVDLFLTIFYISQNENLFEEDRKKNSKILLQAANNYGFDSVNEFISEHIRDFLLSLQSPVVWIEEGDPTLRVFLFLLRFKGIELELENVSAIMKERVDPKTVPLVAFAILQELTEVQRRVAQNKDEILLQNWTTFLKGYILELLSQHRGRTGESLRLASISSLLSIVKFSGKENRLVFEAVDECMSHLESLVCEDFAETRILSCSFIQEYLTSYSSFIEPPCFYKLIQMLVARLDDRDAKVRRIASAALYNCFKNYSRAKEIPEKVKCIVRSVAIYLKEDDEFVRKNIAETVKILRKACPDLVDQELKGEENVQFLMEIQNMILN